MSLIIILKAKLRGEQVDIAECVQELSKNKSVDASFAFLCSLILVLE